MKKFRVQSTFTPTGDQPVALAKLFEGIQRGHKKQTLLGVTGSGKTFTIATLIEKVQRPTLVIAHNKTLAAQLCSEFKEFFPDNAVEYFVSYYDYYQPEAYIPHTDTYIEKDMSINEEIDRLRNAATMAVMTRRDVIVVASVSCIYGLGSPEVYAEMHIELVRGKKYDRENIFRKLVDMQYDRNDVDFGRGKFRLRGDIVEIYPVYGEYTFRLDFFGEELDKISEVDALTGEILLEHDTVQIFPAKHFVTTADHLTTALQSIEQELVEQVKVLQSQGKELEAQRLQRRTRFDIEMMQETGYCSGIENYSRHLDGRKAGQPPYTLLDYFPDDFLLCIDESHMTIPQLRGMYEGDKSRKDTLVEYGFRLPSARDNRPLRFTEFEQKINQVIFTSATPGDYEQKSSDQVVEQLIRPTGLVDPRIEVRTTSGQLDDLIKEIKLRVTKAQRVLVTTLTKKMAEDLTEYLLQLDIKVTYLHFSVETLERIEILRDLRLGVYDVVVGINLLREGLDLPEVSLVAILDADKEGFLRSTTALIQTIGRAARHVEGKVIMYAEQMTDSMQRAIEETNRRRKIQQEYNEQHSIIPKTIEKGIRESLTSGQHEKPYGKSIKPRRKKKKIMARNELVQEIKRLEKAMQKAAKKLDFEDAAAIRDEIKTLRKELLEIDF